MNILLCIGQAFGVKPGRRWNINSINVLSVDSAEKTIEKYWNSRAEIIIIMKKKKKQKRKLNQLISRVRLNENSKWNVLLVRLTDWLIFRCMTREMHISYFLFGFYVRKENENRNPSKMFHGIEWFCFRYHKNNATFLQNVIHISFEVVNFIHQTQKISSTIAWNCFSSIYFCTAYVSEHVFAWKTVFDFHSYFFHSSFTRQEKSNEMKPPNILMSIGFWSPSTQKRNTRVSLYNGIDARTA